MTTYTPATPQDILYAQLQLLRAQIDHERAHVTQMIATLAVEIINDKHGPTSRNAEAAVEEAAKIYRLSAVESLKPGLYGAA
jgi:hypothetical protein